MRSNVVRSVCSGFAVLAFGACTADVTGPGPEGSPLPSGLTLKLEHFIYEDSVDATPAFLTQPLDDGRIFIVEYGGRIRVVRNGALQKTPFLDISGRGGWTYSVAFHPQYATNHFFYVFWMAPNYEIRIERFSATGNPEVADPASAKVVISVPGAHFGGLVRFGPDGMLYISIGDDMNPQTGQDTNSLLASLLRLDVDHGDPYAIPPDNPFVGQANRRGEIWAKGLQNPTGYSFDSATGRLYMIDEGRWDRGELNIVPASQGGVNYGWDIMEGSYCNNATNTCDKTGLTLPVLTWGRYVVSCPHRGGHVYRGKAIPELWGHYLYTSECTWSISSLWYKDGAVVLDHSMGVVVNFPVSFGVDFAGEPYVLLGSEIVKVVRGG
jgi:glucose/arabinose dehydrogenase